MEIEIKNKMVRVSEEGFFDAGFQLSEQPSKTNFKPGDEEKIYFAVRNKGGLERTCYAKLQLLDANDKVALEIRQENKTDFTGFDVTLLPLTIKIPADFTEGRYRTRLELIYDNGNGIDDSEAERHTVAKVHGNDETLFDISSQATRIENTPTTDFRLTVNGNTLTVQGKALQWIKIFDQTGRLLKQAAATSKHSAVLSLSGLPQGVYLMQAADGGHVYARRFLKR